jgi:hypothetical protein
MHGRPCDARDTSTLSLCEKGKVKERKGEERIKGGKEEKRRKGKCEMF